MKSFAFFFLLIIFSNKLFTDSTFENSIEKSKNTIMFKKQILDFDDIRIDFKQEEIILQGKKTTIKYKVTNTGNGFLVFGTGMSKYGGVYKKDNKFYHNTMQQQQTPPVFFNFLDVIPPNSTTEKSFEIRPFKSGRIMHIETLHYFKIDETNVNKLFVYESKDDMALPGALVTIVYRSIKDLNEFKNIITTSFTEILIPQIHQQDLKRTIRYELEIDIEENQIFQELYSKFKPKDIIELKEIADLALNTDKGKYC